MGEIDVDGRSPKRAKKEDLPLYFASNLTPEVGYLPNGLFHATMTEPYWTYANSDLDMKRYHYYRKVLASEGFYSDEGEFSEFKSQLFPSWGEFIPCTTDETMSLLRELATFALSKGLENDSITLTKIIRANLECDNLCSLLYTRKDGHLQETKYDVGDPYLLTIKASDNQIYEAQVFFSGVCRKQFLEKGIRASSFEGLGVELCLFRIALHYPEIKYPSWWSERDEYNASDSDDDYDEDDDVYLCTAGSAPAPALAPAPPNGSVTLKCGGLVPKPLQPSDPVFLRVRGKLAELAYKSGEETYASFEASFVKRHRPEDYAAYEAAYMKKRGAST